MITSIKIIQYLIIIKIKNVTNIYKNVYNYMNFRLFYFI